MLQFINDENNTRKWGVTSKDLRSHGLRSPNGFTFALEGSNHYFWTSQEFAAFLFYKRHPIATPEVVAYFEEKYKKEKELYELSFSTETDKIFQAPEGVAFYPYQNVGIDYCSIADNVLIADFMRIGKTATAIGVLNGGFDKTLIVCPKTAKLVWVRELNTFLLDKTKKVQVLTAQSEIDYNASIYILNYDLLEIQSELAEIDFDLIIADEVHKAKNQNAQRTKYLFALNGKKKLGLSGTPLLNKPKDFLTVLRWLNPFWKDFYFYKGNFVTKTGISLTLEEVQDVARSTMMVRRTQAQVFSQEPIERRVVPLNAPKDIIHLVEMEKASYRKLWRLNDYTTARKLLGLSRVQYAVNHILTYTSSSEKMVVFAYHKEVVDRIATSLGNHAVVIYGDTTDKQRKENVERFQNDPECFAIIGNLFAMGEAINLSVAHHLLFVETDWSPGVIEQAEERCSNKNQEHPVLVEFLCYEDSLDSHMFSIREGKEIISDRATNLII